MGSPARPAVFVLGGAKISDAFGMLGQVLANGSAGAVLTGGVTANVFLMAKGVELGAKNEAFLKGRSLDAFIAPARECLAKYPGKIHLPSDLACEAGGAMVRYLSGKKLPLIDSLEKAWRRQHAGQ